MSKSRLPETLKEIVLFYLMFLYLSCIFYLLYKCVKYFVKTARIPNYETENIEMRTFERVTDNEAREV